MRKNKIVIKDDIVLRPDDSKGSLNFSEIFTNPGPVQIEIGSGKGTFLVSQSQKFPDINYLGIEWANKYYRYAADRFRRWQLKNVRIIRTDASQFIADHIMKNSIEMFHIYFPDPWPKKKHNKRRFFNIENVSELYRCLKDEGIINIATDHSDYYQQMLDVSHEVCKNGKFKKIDFIRPQGAREGEMVGTNYERKYLKEGRRTNILALQKI